MFGRKTYSWHMSPLHRHPRLSIATHCCSGQRWRWPSVRLSTGALCFSLVPVDLLATGAHHSTSHWLPSICWQLTFHIIFVAGKLLYGLCRRRSRCTFTHCMFSRNVFLPPASRPVHRRPLLFWPPAPVDLLLKVVAHNCCP